MKVKALSLLILSLMVLSGCKKDFAEDWAGTYDGTSGNNTVQRVVVTKVDKQSVKMELQTQTFVGYVTFATVGNGKLTSATKVEVNEDGSLYGSNATYRFTGTGTLSGTTLTITGIATNKNDASDVQGYYFVGNR